MVILLDFINIFIISTNIVLIHVCHRWGHVKLQHLFKSFIRHSYCCPYLNTQPINTHWIHKYFEHYCLNINIYIE